MIIWFDTEFQDDGRTVDLISIGAVRSDGAEYYAEADWVDLRRSNAWVENNVHPHLKGGDTLRRRADMAADLQRFAVSADEWWADCPAYDWVVMCQLYGTMMQRPASWPLNASCLRQWSRQLGVDPRDWPEQAGDALEDARCHHALEDARYHRVVWQHLASREKVLCRPR